MCMRITEEQTQIMIPLFGMGFLMSWTFHDIDLGAYLIAMTTLLWAVYSHSADRWTRLSLYLSYVTQGGHVDSYPYL